MPTGGSSSRPPIRRRNWTTLPRPKSFARLMTAADGRLWLLFRHHPLPGGVRETWAEYAMSLRRQGLEQAADAGQFRRHSGQPAGPGALRPRRRDGRLQQRLAAAGREQPGGRRPVAAEGRSLCRRSSAAAVRWSPRNWSTPWPDRRPIEPVHPHEPQDIQRLRDYRVECGGKTYHARPRRVPSPHRIHGPSRRRRFAGGHVALRPGRGRHGLAGQRRPRQRLRPPVSLVDHAEDHGHLPQPALVHRPLHLRAERASGPTGTAT